MYINSKLRNGIIIIGLTLMILLGIVAIIDAMQYVSYNKSIKNEEVTETVAHVTDYNFTLYEKIGRDSDYFECSETITYEVDGIEYTDEDNECLSRNDRTYVTIYYYNDNPDRYFYYDQVLPKVFLSFIWPIIGAGIFVFGKKSEGI